MDDKKQIGSYDHSLRNNVQQQYQNNQPNTHPLTDKFKSSSDFIDSYFKYMNKKLNTQEINQLYKILRENNVTIDENDFQSSLQLEIVDTDFQSYVIFLHYGIFKITIKVLMTEIADRFFASSVISSGSYGSIYSMWYSQKDYAVKRVLFEKQANFDHELQKVYKEYFLCCLASYLKVGPKVCNIFGYDIIATKNSAFFAMELCQNLPKHKYPEILKSSIENLRTLHSLKFIHLDIKPANLAYSLQFRKCVFIDFGLSRLIAEDIGFKTFTNFIGTISYCSEEMRKIYILKKPKFIDLYHNDSVSLENTLEKIEFRQKFQNSQDFKFSQPQYSESSIQVSLIQESIIIFQMKYHIFSNNIETVKKIVPKFFEWPRSFYAILNSKTAQCWTNKNKAIQDHINHIKNIIRQKNSMGNTVDSILGQAFEKMNGEEGASKFTIQQKIINFTNLQFKTILQNQEFIFSIILYLDEFSKEGKNNQYKQKLILKLLKKVVDVKNEGLTEIYKEIDYFLNYLNQNLKKNRNYKSLSVLRILYFRMDDFKSIQPLEDEIITLIQSPVMKCLKISQFVLLWSLTFNKIRYYKIDIWMQTIKKLYDSEQNSLFFMKIKQFSLTLLQHISQWNYLYSDVEKLLKLIQQCQQDPRSRECHEQIYIVKTLYEQYEEVQYKNLQRNQMLQIDKVYFPSLQFLGSQKQYEQKSFFKVFKSCQRYLLTNNPLKNFQKNEVKNCVNYVFYKFRGRPDLINPSFYENLTRFIKYDKELVIIFLTKFLENVQILLNQFIYFSQYQMNFIEECIKKLLSLLQQLRAKKEYGLYDVQFNSYLEKINRLKKLCIYKFLLSVQKKNLYQTYDFIPKVLKLKYLLMKKQYENMEKKMEQILQQYSLRSYHENCLLITYFETQPEIIRGFSKNIEKKFEDLIIKLCQNYIKQEEASFLSNYIYIAEHSIRIYLKRNQFQKAKVFIERMITELEQKNTKIKNLPENYFSIFCLYFVYETNVQRLLNIYTQISFKKEEFQRNCFPFYVISVFFGLYSKSQLQKKVLQRQLKRSCLCLSRMMTLLALKSKRIIIHFSDLLVKKKRKKVICSRLQMRYPISEQGPEKLNYVLKSEVESIQKKKIKQYLLRKKIFLINF